MLTAGRSGLVAVEVDGCRLHLGSLPSGRLGPVHGRIELTSRLGPDDVLTNRRDRAIQRVSDPLESHAGLAGGDHEVSLGSAKTGLLLGVDGE